MALEMQPHSVSYKMNGKEKLLVAWAAQAPFCAVTSQESISLPEDLVDGRLWSGEITLVSSEVFSARSCMQRSLRFASVG